MRSYKRLWDQFVSEDNCREAIDLACRHKGARGRKGRKARYYRDHADELAPRLVRYAANFRSAPHRTLRIYDGIRRKERVRGARTVHDARQMLSYLGWLDATDTYGMYRRRVGPHVCFRQMRRQVGRWQRRRNLAIGA